MTNSNDIKLKQTRHFTLVKTKAFIDRLGLKLLLLIYLLQVKVCEVIMSSLINSNKEM